MLMCVYNVPGVTICVGKVVQQSDV